MTKDDGFKEGLNNIPEEPEASKQLQAIAGVLRRSNPSSLDRNKKQSQQSDKKDSPEPAQETRDSKKSKEHKVDKDSALQLNKYLMAQAEIPNQNYGFNLNAKQERKLEDLNKETTTRSSAERSRKN